MSEKPKKYCIRYRATPRTIVDSSWLLGVMSACLFFFAIVLTGGNLFLAAAAAASCTLIVGLIGLSYDRLTMTRQGISFPLFLLPMLQFRSHRTWLDVGAVMLSDTEGPDYFETADIDSKDLVIHFNSGGHVRLSLSVISTSDLDSFFKASKAWGSTAVFAPELIELKRKLFSGPATQTKQLTFTELWEDELQSHFTATNFVPLDKGKQLNNGRFKVVSQLAAGGLSAIYLAEKSDKSTVVLKECVVPAHMNENSVKKARELFGREAQLLMKLDHPRIAKVFDHFVDSGRDYLVLQYVQGLSLRQLVTRDGPQPEDRVLEWGAAVATILEYLHGLSPPLVHRDISPDNLLLRSDGALFLIDFGAANEFVGTATSTLIGKQCYISPEQFRGKARPASDIYSLGATMHYLLTGQEPEALAVSHPALLSGGVSQETDALVAACTQPELSDRICDARSLRIQAEETRLADRNIILRVTPRGGKT